jgi:hypothetical protein
MAARNVGGSRLPLGPLTVMALCLGALTVIGVGSRGKAWFFFILASGFVLGVGLLINHIAERLRSKVTE